MNMKKYIGLYLMILVCLPAVTACGKTRTTQMVNELQFSMNHIKLLQISYDEENISFYPGEEGVLTIKEYMTDDKESYYAKVSESSDRIKISEGGKPLFKDGFARYVEVYLPADYCQDLSVTSTNGEIDLSNISLKLSVLSIDNTSGTIIMDNTEASKVYLSSAGGNITTGDIRADIIRLESTGSSIACDELNGTVDYTSTNGSINVKSAIGSGSYRVSNAGELNVVYSEVSGDLVFYNKNDDISLTLPQNLQFYFEATTKNGSITTDFQQLLTIDGDTASGVIGDEPAIAVRTETKNGNIEIMQ